jgi:DNA-binding NarL/FixJ family response regulator
MKQIIRVLIADDSAAVREDLKILLQLINGIEVIGEADCGRFAVDLVRSLHPDLVIIDLEMEKVKSGDKDGILAIREIKSIVPAPRIFVLTVHGYPSARQAALQAGADAFFIKGLDTDYLIETISNLRKVDEKNENDTR